MFHQSTQLHVHVTNEKLTRNWTDVHFDQLLVWDDLLPLFVERCTTSLLRKIQMTASFLHSHQDCRRCSLLVSWELSGMLRSTWLSAQLHRRSQKGFQLVTQASFLTNSCLKDGNYHRDLGRITGKISHLSTDWKMSLKQEEHLQLSMCLKSITLKNTCIQFETSLNVSNMLATGLSKSHWQFFVWLIVLLVHVRWLTGLHILDKPGFA